MIIFVLTIESECEFITVVLGESERFFDSGNGQDDYVVRSYPNKPTRSGTGRGGHPPVEGKTA